MFRILLAQSNENNCKIIKNALSDKASEIEYIEVALNINDIIRNVEMLKPDILFISHDINEDTCFLTMNKLLEKKVFGRDAKNEKKLYVVVTSRSDNYDTVRKAFKLGAKDCIVEPLNRNVIIDTVEGIMENILSDRIEHFQKEIFDRKMSEYDVLWEHIFFYDIMFNEGVDKRISDWKEFWDEDESGFIVTFEIKTISGENVDYFEAQKKVRHKLRKKMKMKMGPIINGRLSVYIKCESSYLSDKIKVNNLLYWTGEEICDLIKGEFKAEVSAGVGSVYPIKNVCISYEESLRALEGNEDVNIFKENYTDNEENLMLYKEKLEKLIESIEMGSTECFGNFSAVLATMDNLSDEEKYNRVILILTFVTCAVKRYTLYEVQTKYCLEEFKKNFAIKQEGVNEWAIKRFNNLIKNEKKYSLKEYSEYVKFCVEYIHSHYREDIVLKEVANMCGVSMQYLSKMFREETGMNFVEFLNDFRIKKAKELMLHPKVSIKEICFEVGYNDPNYFSRIFKKNTGKTPREYVYEYNEHINSTD